MFQRSPIVTLVFQAPRQVHTVLGKHIQKPCSNGFRLVSSGCRFTQATRDQTLKSTNGLLDRASAIGLRSIRFYGSGLSKEVETALKEAERVYGKKNIDASYYTNYYDKILNSKSAITAYVEKYMPSSYNLVLLANMGFIVYCVASIEMQHRRRLRGD